MMKSSRLPRAYILQCIIIVARNYATELYWVIGYDPSATLHAN